MRTSHTAVVERDATFTGDFETEPYEAGWASEARWFVHTHEMRAGAVLHVFAQVSPDGLHWCDDEVGERVETAEETLFSFAQTGFGQWLRLRCGVRHSSGLSVGEPSVRVTVTLALKG